MNADGRDDDGKTAGGYPHSMRPRVDVHAVTQHECAEVRERQHVRELSAARADGMREGSLNALIAELRVGGDRRHRDLMLALGFGIAGIWAVVAAVCWLARHIGAFGPT